MGLSSSVTEPIGPTRCTGPQRTLGAGAGLCPSSSPTSVITTKVTLSTSHLLLQSSFHLVLLGILTGRFTSHFPLGDCPVHRACSWLVGRTSHFSLVQGQHEGCLASYGFTEFYKSKQPLLTFTFPEEERGTLTFPSMVPGCAVPSCPRAVPSPRLSNQKHLQRLDSAQTPGPLRRLLQGSRAGHWRLSQSL